MSIMNIMLYEHVMLVSTSNITQYNIIDSIYDTILYYTILYYTILYYSMN